MEAAYDAAWEDHRSLLAGAASCVMPFAAWSQQTETTASAQQRLLQNVRPSSTLEKYLSNLRMDFFGADADGDGQITERDVDFHALMGDVKSRTRAISMTMRYDLDVMASSLRMKFAAVENMIIECSLSLPLRMKRNKSPLLAS